MNFGAFVEIAPGKEGLVHISKLDDHRVEHVEDVVAVGDPIIVMVTDTTSRVRPTRPRKDALAAIAKAARNSSSKVAGVLFLLLKEGTGKKLIGNKTGSAAPGKGRRTLPVLVL